MQCKCLQTSIKWSNIKTNGLKLFHNNVKDWWSHIDSDCFKLLLTAVLLAANLFFTELYIVSARKFAVRIVLIFCSYPIISYDGLVCPWHRSLKSCANQVKRDHWSAGFCSWSDPWTMSESFICLYLWCMVVSTGNFVSCSFLRSQNVILVILDCRVRAYWCFGQPTLTYFLTSEVLYHFTVYLYTYSRTSSHSKPWPGSGNNLGFSMSKTSLFFACLYN